MASSLAPQALDQLFRTARTPGGWTNRPVPDETLRELYELFKWGPTASNTCPARFVWVRTPEAKERLARVVLPPNRPKILAAPVTVILGYDMDFTHHLPKLLTPQRLPVVLGLLKQHPEMLEPMAMRNGSLQGAYLLLAARALGLDAWPMSGFENAGVDQEFFSGTSVRSNFLCGLGYADGALAYPRSGRLSFEEASRLA